MAVMAGVLNETQRRTLEAVCDTFVPAVDYDGDDATMKAYMGRSAGDLQVAAQMEGLMAQAMMPEDIAGFAALLDALAQNDFASLPLEVRTGALHQVSASGPEGKLGVKMLKNLTLLFFYALPDEQGRNPNWEAIGYPGPISAPPSAEEAPKTIAVEQVSGAEATLTADVCVIGSGAGGGVIAAELQRAGKSVLVLEQGGYRNEQDFKQLELPGSLELYLSGGLLQAEDGSISVLAGATLGGGTVVNYMNCIRTPDHIRKEWAEFGLEGLDEPGYDEHIDAVWERLTVNDAATSQNRSHRKMILGLESSGFPWKTITRNADATCDDPQTCGYCYTGCQRGCKQSTMKTYLQDASDAGARFVVGARAERVLTEDGRATGVEATVTNVDGSTTKLVVSAPTVVVAAGSVESPALLLSSGIGGPAAGKHLRLHPASLVIGLYEEPIEGWIGQAQSAVSYQFANQEGDWGYLIESVPMAPALVATGLPWVDGADHKRRYSGGLKHMAPFISVARDHGEGEVAIDNYGRAVVRWSLSDEVDRRLLVSAQVELAKLHKAAGAKEIHTLHASPVRWNEGDDFDAFVAAIESASYDANDIPIYTAHQLCSCRMGSDPDESVADGRGELHDTKGVWVGDASAFPTAPGVNPMISIMSLAHRTAGEILKGA
jgi:choline dehydrogenase-like flavoprotein